jgi:hypothetical protein
MQRNGLAIPAPQRRGGAPGRERRRGRGRSAGPRSVVNASLRIHAGSTAPAEQQRRAELAVPRTVAAARARRCSVAAHAQRKGDGGTQTKDQGHQRSVRSWYGRVWSRVQQKMYHSVSGGESVCHRDRQIRASAPAATRSVRRTPAMSLIHIAVSVKSAACIMHRQNARAGPDGTPRSGRGPTPARPAPAAERSHAWPGSRNPRARPAPRPALPPRDARLRDPRRRQMHDLSSSSARIGPPDP